MPTADLISTPALTFEEFRGMPLPAGPPGEQPDVRVVRTIEEVRALLDDSQCRTILWKRDPEKWVRVLGDLYSYMTAGETLTERQKFLWNHNANEDSYVIPAAKTSAEIVQEILQRGTFVGFARSHPASWEALFADMRSILETVALMNEEQRLRTGRFSDAPVPPELTDDGRQVLHYHPEDFTAIVDYSPEGAGSLLARHDTLEQVDQMPRQDLLNVSTNEDPFHLLPNVVVFMKGGSVSSEFSEVGSVHASPDLKDARFPCKTRLAFGAYTVSKKAARLRTQS